MGDTIPIAFCDGSTEARAVDMKVCSIPEASEGFEKHFETFVGVEGADEAEAEFAVFGGSSRLGLHWPHTVADEMDFIAV